MKNLKQKLLLVSVASAICMNVNAGIQDRDTRFNNETFELPAKSVVSSPDVASPLLNNNKEAVHFSWKIDSGFVPNPIDVLSSTSESVEYWQNLTGAELNKGLNISTSAPGALVRISEKAQPLQKGAAQKALTGIEPLELVITSPNGNKMANGKAMSLKASPQTLRDAGSPFPNGTTGFQLKETLGSGTFNLRNSKALNPNTEYVLHVFDKHSNKRLSVTREQSSYKVGDTMTIHGDLTNNYKAMNISSVTGFVLSPRGKVMPLNVKQGVSGQFSAHLALSKAAEFGGLYEAYIDASSIENGTEIKRRVKTAFAITNPTASMRAVSGTLDYGLPVSIRVKDAGRYEVRGVLYGSNASGELTPFMATSAAQWLERGKHGINLKFDSSLVASSGLQAPYEIRHLQLFDQSRMGSLQILNKAVGVTSQVKALTIQPAPPVRTLANPNATPSLKSKAVEKELIKTTMR